MAVRFEGGRLVTERGEALVSGLGLTLGDPPAASWRDPTGEAALAAREIYDARWPRLDGEDEQTWRARQARLAAAVRWDPTRHDPRGRYTVIVRRRVPGRPVIAREVCYTELSDACLLAEGLAAEAVRRGWAAEYQVLAGDRVLARGEARP